MREYLYRGKRIDRKDPGKWVYGDLLKNCSRNDYEIRVNDKTSEYFGNSYGVDPETVGEFTGLTDKNGTRVFEGDIVRFLYTDWCSKSEKDPRTLEEYLHDIASIGIVVWNNKDCCFCVQIRDSLWGIDCGKYGYIEVIGNIYDNADLLEGKNG